MVAAWRYRGSGSRVFSVGGAAFGLCTELSDHGGVPGYSQEQSFLWNWYADDRIYRGGVFLLPAHPGKGAGGADRRKNHL